MDESRRARDAAGGRDITPEQTVRRLSEGRSTAEAAKQVGVSKQPYYRSSNQYGAMEARRSAGALRSRVSRLRRLNRITQHDRSYPNSGSGPSRLLKSGV